VFVYIFTRSLFPGPPHLPNPTDEQSVMTYRGVHYERSPSVNESERSPHTPTPENPPQNEEGSAVSEAQLDVPNSVVRLTYRGVPYIRFR
jgi:hypothetical protein